MASERTKHSGAAEFVISAVARCRFHVVKHDRRVALEKGRGEHMVVEVLKHICFTRDDRCYGAGLLQPHFPRGRQHARRYSRVAPYMCRAALGRLRSRLNPDGRAATLQRVVITAIIVVVITIFVMRGVRDRVGEAWRRFFLAETSAEDFLQAVLDEHSCGHRCGGTPPVKLAKVFGPSGGAPWVIDPERRLAIQLAWMHRFPKQRTPCCGERFCFRCKVSSWHRGITCEERLGTEKARQAQLCPGCGVPVQR
ncbi:unnamed protein product, partial [Prorocentrum cordatum]